MKTQTRCLYDDVMTLKTAIEEAIIKGQKSMADPNDIPESDLVSNEDSVPTCVHAGSGLVGWVDDF